MPKKTPTDILLAKAIRAMRLELSDALGYPSEDAQKRIIKNVMKGMKNVEVELKNFPR